MNMALLIRIFAQNGDLVTTSCFFPLGMVSRAFLSREQVLHLRDTFRLIIPPTWFLQSGIRSRMPLRTKRVSFPSFIPTR